MVTSFTWFTDNLLSDFVLWVFELLGASLIQNRSRDSVRAHFTSFTSTVSAIHTVPIKENIHTKLSTKITRKIINNFTSDSLDIFA